MQQMVLDGPGWKARGDFVAPQADTIQPFLPRLRHIISSVTMFIRFFAYAMITWWRGRGQFMSLSQLFRKSHNPFYGVPCGGIGSGGIGRDFRGGFCKFSLLPGIVEHHIGALKGDQFIVTVRRQSDGDCVYQKLLSCIPFSSTPLSAWNSYFPAQNISYRGLYPRSWTLFSIPELDINLLCRQVSPVLPHNYEDTSLPVCMFIWKIENNSKLPYFVTITLAFRDGVGKTIKTNSLCSSKTFNSPCCSGVKLHHELNGLKVCYGIGVKHEEGIDVSCSDFDPASDGSTFWNSLSSNVNREKNFNGLHINESRELGIATSAEVLVNPRMLKELEMALVWDMPIIKFGTNQRTYKRRYTRLFDSNKDLVEAICTRAFTSRSDWEDIIELWQNEILNDETLPQWYKSAVFNELYYMTDGGTCWVEFDENWRNDEMQMSDQSVKHFAEFGRFAYLESWEYLMMNTYDVHFYSSFAFLANWPQIELSIQYDYADQLFCTDDRKDVTFYVGNVASVKQYGRIPHDLGSPKDDPWLFTNAYRLSDTCDWKDLNLKFVLTCYRDYMLIIEKSDLDEGSKNQILQRFYDLSMFVIKDSAKWDSDSDGMIENSGYPDQTYDAWVMNGTSAYCGGLWLCTLECCRSMAKLLSKNDDEQDLEAKLEKARASYVRKLWNGSYFDFDERSPHRKTIMADHLCGFWYLSMIDGVQQGCLIDPNKIRISLDTIFKMNVKKFENGTYGPVNGIFPNGKHDLSSVQSEEVWGGTAYALASFQILMDQRVSGFETAEGWYRSCWEQFGLQYQTPEAICGLRYYRAIGYMRPLAIWAMQMALDMKQIEQQNVE